MGEHRAHPQTPSSTKSHRRRAGDHCATRLFQIDQRLSNQIPVSHPKSPSCIQIPFAHEAGFIPPEVISTGIAPGAACAQGLEQTRASPCLPHSGDAPGALRRLQEQRQRQPRGQGAGLASAKTRLLPGRARHASACGAGRFDAGNCWGIRLSSEAEGVD